MVDFAKMLREQRKPRIDHLYRCKRCGEEAWFITEMRGELADGCVDVLKRCRGPMVLIATQPEGKPEERIDMGFAEIQAAFAAQGQAPAPQPVTQAPAVAQASAFTPSPFTPQPSVPLVATFTPAVQPLPASAQASFTFTPPAGFNPASAPPINPPGERAALAAPTPAPAAPNPPVAAAPAEAPGVTAAPTSPAPTQPSAAGFSPPSASAEPKRRGRKAKVHIDEQGGEHSHPEAAVPAVPSLAADGAAIATMPPDGSSVEDIVSELFARGVSSVHLTFTKDGK